MCPVVHVENGLSDFSNCVEQDKCFVGTPLQFTCASGYSVSSPTTTCRADHTWSGTPVCSKGMHDDLIVLIDTNVFTMFDLVNCRPSKCD